MRKVDNTFQARTVKSSSRLSWGIFLTKFQIQRVLLSMYWIGKVFALMVFTRAEIILSSH